MEQLNSKQRKVLEAVAEHPPRSDLEWKAVEKLLLALGATLREGKGSRIRIYLNEVATVFHRPHPQRVMDKGSVKALQDFLTRAKIIS